MHWAPLLLLAALASTRAGRGQQTGLAFRRLPAQLLASNASVEYLLQLSLGRPGQSMAAALDTRAPWLMVTSVMCASCYACTGRKIRAYDHSDSSSYRPIGARAELRFSSGLRAWGLLGTDLASLNLGGLQVGGQEFCEATWVSDEFVRLHADSLLGLLPLEGSLLAGLSVGEFSLELSSAHTGQLSLNATTRAGLRWVHCSGCLASTTTTTTTPPPQVGWQFELQRVDLAWPQGPAKQQVAVGGEPGRPQVAIVDSTRALLVGPVAQVRALNLAMGARELAGGLFEFERCQVAQLARSLPRLGLWPRGAGEPLTLEPADYVVVERHLGANSTRCLSGLAAELEARDGPAEVARWLLGDLFLRAHYTHFDWQRKRLGFVRRLRSSYF